jgi:aminoglycoside phosphotransferase (APT) family kinase protein
MPSPDADIVVDETLVRGLLASQHPDLADRPLTELDSGWDNTLWRLGSDLLVRLPRRAVAAPLVANEQRWLPVLSPRLPLPVPAPVRVGQPTDEYPWAWSIIPWLEGGSGDRTPIDRPAESADRLGRFLRALHQPAPSDAPHNPFRSVPLVERSDSFEQRLHQLATSVDAPAIRDVWDRALDAEQLAGPAKWLHGDLHPANVLIVDGAVGGVIDFGDVCAGDPATDLAGAWMLLPASSIDVFCRAYGGLDADLESRSLGWVVLFALMFVVVGVDDRPTYEPIGRAALAHAVAHIADGA